ncbi:MULTISPECIES: polysaccharide deacetylase family protein [Streptomyces]|uniref:Peptidoglycan/xylan/chitin deacetylase (PgdA/CDA1 family) n=1 Tax=Streptomyces calvus TaxID=67282 RepID=A0A514JLX1_9ACTN|nr:polysaccharide deacetylase family protein [Streptomyces calvus]MBA8942485.1 peptidoglycan/xylan/chitin deacetylase (PgdA/CDA1 family) [Streptomyces calvus]MBA8975578.1 peptidoglycan/xylan/chitin deacetylase (PgdA/CDA1 family) [Streptomyces calvus]MYS30979.1 polysaccharide deacetylase family protein [Streptomyces sp. SID7804]QDI68319.1 polysaccharide deacetylase [Streptomyces calvus]
MITLVRRAVAVCALGAALASCATSRPAQQPPRPAPSLSPAVPSSPPTLAPGPSGLTPVFRNGPRTAGRTVALTFDADMTADQGPRARSGERFDHPRLIAALRELGVPATVFMTGRWAEEYPDQARSIGRDPLFEVANHSYSHYAFTGDCYGLPTVSADLMRADVERAYAAFRRVGVPEAMPYFRFPGGCYDRRALRALAPAGVTAVQWDVVGGDAFATDAAAVARQVVDGVRPGSVVVLHCTRSAAPTTERAVRTIVPELRSRGYRFVKVSELIAAGHGRG